MRRRIVFLALPATLCLAMVIGVVASARLATDATESAETASGFAVETETDGDRALLDLDESSLEQARAKLWASAAASTTTTTTRVVEEPADDPTTTTIAATDPGYVTTGFSAPHPFSGELPVPDLLPTDPYAPTPEIKIGRIEIPRLGVDHSLFQGMTLTDLNRGPSHWPGTALPGEVGNAVIGGHRTTHSRPFRNLDQLQPGDDVIYTTNVGRYRYQITSVDIVTPDAVHIADQRHEYEATLFACHPPGSARYRIVAKMELVDEAGNPVDAAEIELAA